MTTKLTTANANAKTLTADELLRLYARGIRGELIKGALHETMPTGGEHGETVSNLHFLMAGVVKPFRLGRLATSDSGVWLERDPDTVREPDIAFISAERLPLDVRVRGYYEVTPDLVVEVVSPSNSRRKMDEKARMWLEFGALLVWVVYSDTRSVDVYPEDGKMTTLSENDTLDGGDVLPGFSCAVSEIFEL